MRLHDNTARGALDVDLQEWERTKKHHEYVISKTHTEENSMGQTAQVSLQKDSPHFA